MCKYFVLLGSSRGKEVLTGPMENGEALMRDESAEGFHSWLAPLLQQHQSQLQVCGSFTCAGTTAAGPVGSVWSQRHCRHERVSESRNNRSKRWTLRILYTHPSVYPQSLSCARHARQVSYTQQTWVRALQMLVETLYLNLTSKIWPHHCRKETPCGAEAVQVGGAKISPSRNLASL